MTWWTVVLYILLGFLPKLYSSDDQAICSIDTDPVVYGKPVKLLCSLKTSKCVENETRLWKSGGDILMFNGVSNNITKYREDILSCSEFSFTIPAMLESNLNREYTCTVGFKSCSLLIKVSVEHFEYHPSRDTTELQINDSALGLTFLLHIQKLFPVPVCTIVIGETTLDNLMKTNVQRFGVFYQVVLEAKYLKPVKTCPLLFNVTCHVGKSNIPLIQGEHNCTSSDVAETFGQYKKIILCSVASLVCLVLIGCSIFRNKQKIINTFKIQLPKRSLWGKRRPILAVITTLGSLTMLVASVITSIQELTIQNQTAVGDLSLAVRFCVSSIILTPLSLCFLSNPQTVSIRQGFKTAGKRFLQKFTRKNLHCASANQTGRPGESRSMMHTSEEVEQGESRSMVHTSEEVEQGESRLMLRTTEEVEHEQSRSMMHTSEEVEQGESRSMLRTTEEEEHGQSRSMVHTSEEVEQGESRSMLRTTEGVKRTHYTD